ncbi:glycoside hydrolase (GH105) [Formosa agariphila KMM 3901]|uniref:Unsaturated 3S-rhamnoglycuronyl hydrolase n=1 Tax=Formosa agariphila (strain DSM 15362 / KCTC 12365 / LMG 23005 / KMM 3901 / M-2Alg 35-1) TaxID=1347342 RepID=PLH33_FORAG|nr:glycoside hydrolase family 88 protein [Formosa agariphila]T2KPL9.1 RecName: Full=Unsaturated 3S-rhamnoglycuronyl hydrolase; AltName: Full=Glycosyl hydrolase 105 family protein P33; Short=P33_GH105; AltName: Full=Polysaccharide utilization locus H protein P33; Short=PUL H protein P33; AltName: Full=Ulvan hydrolase; AltName: Full=Unsaturated beta-glucuronyl hydrolase; Short=UGL; Flags: Precursor [Formosa agariphila KMM 3901]CDF79934.1 glycoside hydrolase (GH105) [Formosa agariphila KMM 3901]
MKNQALKILTLCVLVGSAMSLKLYAQKGLNHSEIEAKMIKALEWQEAHPIFALAPTDWTEGAYYIGVSRAHKTTQDMMYMAALKNQAYWNNWQTYSRLHHADDVAISYSYIYIGMNDKRPGFVNLEPTKKFLDAHLHEDDEWKAGTDKSASGKTILWWWCDALFMAPPVLNLYAKHTNQPKYRDEMHKYYMETYNQLYDKEERLFARDMRFVWKGTEKDLKEPNDKKIFWSRGNGWVLGGLALLLDDMPNDYKHRTFYENLFKDMASRILELQPKDGLWRTSLLSPETYDHGEVSGSGFYTFALAWGVNNGLLDRNKYEPAVKKAWKALADCQHEDGRVGWVQNIGASPEPASADSWQNFGTGAFLMAGSEVLKLEE